MTPASPSAATIPPQQQPLAAGVPAVAASADSTSLWLLPTVLLLTGFCFSFSTIMLLDFRPSNALYLGCSIIGVASVLILFTAPPWPTDHLRSPMGARMLAFTAALLFTTALVYLSGIRTDTHKLIPQVGALLFVAAPYFVMQWLGKKVDASSAVMLSCHVVFAISAISILGDFFGVTRYEYSQGRYFGFLGDGVAWILTLPLMVYFCSRRLMLAAACLLMLGLTGSRAPALCVAAALVFLFSFTRSKRLQYFIIFGLIAAVAAYQSELFATLFGRLADTQVTSNDRLSTAALGLRIFEFSPLFGSGYNAQEYYFPANIRRLELGQFSVQTSTFAQILAEGGLILFAAYLGFVISATRAGIALLRNGQGLPQAGIINGTTVWLLSMLWVNQSATWLLVGSYFGPLLLGIAGYVAANDARLRFVRRYERRAAAGPS